jgi:hypothetical protein
VKVAFDAELWPLDARRADAWIMVSLPSPESEEIRDLVGRRGPGFGSVRVRATIGGSTWTTSIFPARQGWYVLPVKRPVRAAEALGAGDVATVTVELVDFTAGGDAGLAGPAVPAAGSPAKLAGRQRTSCQKMPS